MGHGSTSVRSSSSTVAGQSTSDVSGRRPRLVVSLPFVVSVAVLLFNDHVFEQAWPGWVTGKLSDIAGVVMAPERREFVRALEPTCEGFSSGDVAAVQVGDDLHLVVEMGEGGVLHRSPDGTWEWVAVGVWGVGVGDVPEDSFLGHEIASRPDRGLFVSDWLARTLLLGAPVSALAAAAPLGVLAARRGRSTVAAVLLAALLALVLMAPAAIFLAFLSDASPGRVGGYVLAGGVLCLIAVVGIGLLALWFGRSARPIPDEPAWPTPRFPTPDDD